MTADVPTRFRLRTGYGVRMIGAGCVLLAIAVGCWIVRSLFGEAVAFTVIAAVVTGFAVLVLGIGGVLVAVRPTMLRLEPTVLHNRTGRAVGVRDIAWKDITNIAWSADSFGNTLVVGLADGSSSRINAGVLDANEAEVENAIRTHADAAHGYRPL